MRRMLVAAAMAAVVAAPASGAQFINVLTGGTSGVYYPMGVALSKIWEDAVPDARTSVQSTKASVENLNLLQDGRGEAGLSLGDAVSQAWSGNEEAGFKQPLDKLRGLSAMYSNYIQIVANAESGVKTLGDLKGKRISVGAPKSGTELNARTVFAAAGLSYDDFSKVEYLPFGESVELMKNRQIDATLQSAGLGVASIRDLATSIDIVVVEIPEDVVAKIDDAAYQSSVIPAGTYDGQSEDVATITISNYLITHEEVPEDVVYAMTKSLFENLDQLVAAHAAAKGIELDNAVKGMVVPVHPGAEKYYKEVGVMQ